MSNLLLQSCSASKKEVTSPTPAFEVYTGYFYKILKKSIRNNEFRSDTDIKILSSKYGLIDANKEICYYDQRMDQARAQELNPEVINSVINHIENGKYDRIIINMGVTYREAINGLSECVNSRILEISGNGIGEKGHALHEFVRGDNSVLTEIDDV